MATYGAFILPSLYIGRRLLTSLDVALHRWAMPQRQELASLGIGRSPSSTDAQRWSLNTSLWCVLVRLPSFCISRRLSTLVFCGTRPTRVLCTLSLWHRSAMKGDIERCQKASADVQRWKYERTISRHLYWNDVTLMVHSDFIAAHRSANICVCNAGGHVQKAMSANVGWCKAIEDWMHSTIFRFQGPPFWHENYRSTP